MKLFRGIVLALMPALVLIQANPLRAETLGFSVAQLPSSGRLRVEVRDDRTFEPIAQAEISVSEALPGLSSGSEVLHGRSRSDGADEFASRADRPRTITVQKAGYSTVTLAGVTQNFATIYLKPLEGLTPDSIVSGTLGDYQVEPDGSRVRAGFVLRQLSVFDLLHFDPDSLVSPLMDTIQVFGSRKVPSNLVFPHQKITLVTLDKPGFRLPVDTGKESVLLGIQGEMTLLDLLAIGIGGKKSGPATLNIMNFTRIGISRPFVADANLQLDVPATADLAPAHQVSVSNPPYESEVMVAALTDLQGDRRFLIPTDIKVPQAKRGTLQPVEVKSTTQSLGASRTVLALAMGPKAKRVSGVLIAHPEDRVQVGGFLNAEEPRNFSALPDSVRLSSLSNGISALVLETFRKPEGAKSAVGYPVWYVYSLPAAGEISVPLKNAPVSAPIQGFAISHLEFGERFTGREVEGKTLLQELSRFTRSESHLDSL